MIVNVCDFCRTELTPNNISKKIGIQTHMRLTNAHGMDVRMEMCAECSDKVADALLKLKNDNMSLSEVNYDR